MIDSNYSLNVGSQKRKKPVMSRENQKCEGVYMCGSLVETLHGGMS